VSPDRRGLARRPEPGQPQAHGREELPRRDLFDRSQGKIILLGRGTVRSNAFGDSSTTKIRWDLTLRRVRG